MVKFSIVERNQALPDLPRNEQIIRRVDQVMRDRYAPLKEIRLYSAAERLKALQAVLLDAMSVLEQLESLAAPATKTEIAKHLALLVKSFPNAGSADCEVYGRMLIEDVAADLPAIGDIEDACRQIRRTCRFLPTIAEVIEAIRVAKSRRRAQAGRITELIESKEELERESSARAMSC
jgi:hypothetical protein